MELIDLFDLIWSAAEMGMLSAFAAVAFMLGMFAAACVLVFISGIFYSLWRAACRALSPQIEDHQEENK